MTHREKCDELKVMRKEMADKIGIDLNQSVCTFEGECSGTCPKCKQEEKKLNKALLASGVALAGVMLTACSVTDKENERERTRASLTEESIIEQPLGGEVEYIPDTDDSTVLVEGEIEYNPGNDIEGDVDNEQGNYSTYVITNAVEEYSDAPEVEIVANDGNLVTVRCFETVDDGDGHTSYNTLDMITVNIYTGEMENQNGEKFNIEDFIN